MSKELTIIEKTELRVKELEKQGDISFPANYSPANSLKSAWLILQGVQTKEKKPCLEVCSTKSIANTLFDMVIQGLSPAKKQCYFIPYGNELTLIRSYHGTKAVVKRMKNVIDIVANVIYENDEFTYDIENARIVNVKHKQDFMNIDTDKIKGAYCTIRTFNDKLDDEESYTEVMNMNQINQAWMQSSQNPFEGKWIDKKFVPNKPLTLKDYTVHAKFSEEMAKKTVINRASKQFFNASDDSDLLIESAIRTTENEFNNTDEVTLDDHIVIVADEVEQKQATVELNLDEVAGPEQEEQQASFDDFPDILK